MNVVAITGRLTAAPELKQTASGKSVISFSVAVQRPFTKDVTDFLNVTAWDKSAEFVARFFAKGEMIAVDGYLMQRTYEDRNGAKRSTFEIIAQNIGFCGSKAADQKPAKQVAPELENIPEDNDLPF